MRKLTNGFLQSQERYADVIATVLKSPENGSATGYEEMRKTVPIVELLTDHREEEFILLEEADYEHVCSRMKANKFARNTLDLLTMLETIFSAPRVTPEVSMLRKEQ